MKKVASFFAAFAFGVCLIISPASATWTAGNVGLDHYVQNTGTGELIIDQPNGAHAKADTGGWKDAVYSRTYTSSVSTDPYLIVSATIHVTGNLTLVAPATGTASSKGNWDSGSVFNSTSTNGGSYDTSGNSSTRAYYPSATFLFEVAAKVSIALPDGDGSGSGHAECYFTLSNP